MIYSEVEIIAGFWFHLLSHLIGRSCSYLLICSVLAEKKTKTQRKIQFSAGELYLSLVWMLFLRLCCKHEAPGNRYFVLQKCVVKIFPL